LLSSPRHGYILFGLEPDGDLAAGELASEGLKSADVVVSFSSFVSDSLLECATVLLPIGTFAETSGTFVNAEGRRQTFEGAANPVGESRPGWRVLRVLGNMLEVPNCEYQTSREVLDELTLELGAIVPDNGYAGTPELALDEVEVAIEDVDVPIYSVDALVRRSEPLQATRLGQDARPDADSGFARSA
jgi:NADH-quinone oxidoreductase subunit G